MLPNNTYLTKYLFGVFVLLVIVYAGFEMRNYMNGPDIMLALPQNGTVVHSETIQINGTASNVTSLSLGGDTVVLDENGAFSKELLLSPGVNTFIFVAKDKFNKEYKKHFNVIYKPKTKRKKIQNATGTSTSAKSVNE